MNYFLQAGVDIDGFDPVFKKYYVNTFGIDGKIDYNYRPSNTLKNRDGTYANWTQTSPEDGAWCWKLQSDNFSGIPFLAPMLVSAMENSEVEALQKSKDIASAYGLLMGEIRLFDNAKSGTTANQFAISPKTLAEFMGMVKAGLGDTAKAVAMPTENTKYYQFEDKNPNMTTTQLSASAGQGTGISRVIYSSDRMSSAEIEGAQTEVYNIMRPMYWQFENFLNFFGNKLTKKYRFSVVMDGSNYRWERQQRMDNLMKLSSAGIVLNSSAYAAALGYTPMQFDHMIDEGKYGDFSEKWQMMINTNTASRGDTGGRPLQDTVSDSGEMSRDE